MSDSEIEDILADLPGSEEAYVKYLNACRLIVRKLELKPGEQAVIVNGRVSCSSVERIRMVPDMQ